MTSESRNSDDLTFDEVDRRLLLALEQDPRARVAELGRRIGLSPPAVTERLRRLEEGSVVAFAAHVEPRALGYALCAIVRVNPHGQHLREIPELARGTPEVTECYRITGEDCYFMKLYLRTMDELEPILDRFAPYGRTTTSLVHSAPVPPRPLPLAAPADRAGVSAESRGRR